MVSSVHVHRSVAVLDDFKVCGKPCWVGGCRAGMLHGVSLHFAVWLFILAMGVVMCACLPLLFHRWTAPLPMEKKQAIRGAMGVNKKCKVFMPEEPNCRCSGLGEGELLIRGSVTP